MTEERDIVDFLEMLEAQSSYVREWKYCWDEREKARAEALERRMAAISKEELTAKENRFRKNARRTGKEGGELAQKKWREAAQEQRARHRSERGKASMSRKTRWEGAWRGRQSAAAS